MSDDKQDGANRTSPEMRKASLLLSGLVLTPDSALDSFRKRRAGDTNVDEAALKRARDILDAVAKAISTADPANWDALDRAWHALHASGDRPHPSHAGASDSPSRPAGSGAGAPVAPSSAPSSMPSTPSHPAPTSSRPAPPAPIGTPMAQAPPGIRATGSGSSPSPWVSPTASAAAHASAAMPSPMPPAPPPQAAPPRPAAHPAAVPPPAAAPKAAKAPGMNIDIDALNAIKLDPETGTLPVDAIFADGKHVLPFSGEANAPPPSVVAPTGERDPLGETTSGLHDGVDETLPFGKSGLPSKQVDYAPTARLESMVSPAGPPGSSPADPAATTLPEHLHLLTLEQYAALCAECTVTPQWSAQIHSRYGVRSAAEREALDGHWRAQMKSDANVANTYRWHYNRYEEWAKSRGS